MRLYTKFSLDELSQIFLLTEKSRKDWVDLFGEVDDRPISIGSIVAVLSAAIEAGVVLLPASAKQGPQKPPDPPPTKPETKPALPKPVSAPPPERQVGEMSVLAKLPTVAPAVQRSDELVVQSNQDVDEYDFRPQWKRRQDLERQIQGAAPKKSVGPPRASKPVKVPPGTRSSIDRLASTMPTLGEIIAELKRQAMGGRMPKASTYDRCRPALWPTASAITVRLDMSWRDLAEEAELLPSTTSKRAEYA